LASDVTIAPASGRPVLFTNGGMGAVPFGFDGIDLRRMMAFANTDQEGVFDPTGWKVSEHAAGANLSVDVAANVGMAAVRNDKLLVPRDQYLVAPHNAVITLDGITANATTNPRVDYIVLQVRNGDFDASGFFDARVRYLTGTPTAGATHANPLGAPTVPDSTLLLGQALMSAGAKTLTNAMLRDRRLWALGISNSLIFSAGPIAYAANVFTLITPGLQQRYECSGRPLMLSLTGIATADVANGECIIAWGWDGTPVLRVLQVDDYANDRPMNINASAPVTIPAGSHTIEPYVAFVGGNGKILHSTVATTFTVQELRPFAGNGAA
jgi:hypothetical protein